MAVWGAGAGDLDIGVGWRCGVRGLAISTSPSDGGKPRRCRVGNRKPSMFLSIGQRSRHRRPAGTPTTRPRGTPATRPPGTPARDHPEVPPVARVRACLGPSRVPAVQWPAAATPPPRDTRTTPPRGTPGSRQETGRDVSLQARGQALRSRPSRRTAPSNPAAGHSGASASTARRCSPNPAARGFGTARTAVDDRGPTHPVAAPYQLARREVAPTTGQGVRRS